MLERHHSVRRGSIEVVHVREDGCVWKEECVCVCGSACACFAHVDKCVSQLGVCGGFRTGAAGPPWSFSPSVTHFLLVDCSAQPG